MCDSSSSIHIHFVSSWSIFLEYCIDMDKEPSIVFDLLRKLHSLQEERVHVYKLFDEGHKIYLSTAPNYDFSQFRQLVHDVTQEFKRISNGIILIEKEIRCDYPKLSDLISKLQLEEKNKSEFSAKLQLAKQEAIDNPNVVEKWEHVAQLKEELRKVTAKVNDYLEELRYEMDDLQEEINWCNEHA